MTIPWPCPAHADDLNALHSSNFWEIKNQPTEVGIAYTKIKAGNERNYQTKIAVVVGW